ncbi:hypothetical protein [Mesoterricola silvestris]|uniref:Uncharacterized protein n=1 Tax=Mesoterricola silvestris TaxID=2927979 RepID=A0AA48GHV4_9BACT|nr:hypothetical protein [Mesoterricola silvestris]BDU73181.1 hypothetical protein METEAL_23550 [Mesoterricola silvestris]
MDDPLEAGMVIQGLLFLAPREALEALRQGALLVDLRMEELGACPSNIRPRDGAWRPDYRAQGPREI